MKITVEFDVENDYLEEGLTGERAEEVFRQDLQALLYDEGEASRNALAGTFQIIARQD